MPRKKIGLYTPGAISLLFLPLFGIYFLVSQKAFYSENCMALTFRDNTDKQWQKTEAYIRSRDFRTIAFTGNNRIDSLKARNLVSGLVNFKASKDTLHGIRLHFSHKAQYWTYIFALDALAQAGIPLYMPTGNDLLLANAKPPKPERTKAVKHLDSGSMPTICRVIVEQEKSAIFSISEVKSLVSKYRYPILAFAVLVFFSFAEIRRLPLRR